MWKVFYNEKILKLGGQPIFECNLTEKDIKINFLKRFFLQDTLISWSKVKGNAEQTNIGKEIIWNISKKKIQGKPLFNKILFERGVQFIEHLYDYRKKYFYCFKDFIDLYDLP